MASSGQAFMQWLHPVQRCGLLTRTKHSAVLSDISNTSFRHLLTQIPQPMQSGLITGKDRVFLFLENDNPNRIVHFFLSKSEGAFYGGRRTGGKDILIQVCFLEKKCNPSLFYKGRPNKKDTFVFDKQDYKRK